MRSSFYVFWANLSELVFVFNWLDTIALHTNILHRTNFNSETHVFGNSDYLSTKNYIDTKLNNRWNFPFFIPSHPSTELRNRRICGTWHFWGAWIIKSQVRNCYSHFEYQYIACAYTFYNWLYVYVSIKIGCRSNCRKCYRIVCSSLLLTHANTFHFSRSLKHYHFEAQWLCSRINP